MTIQDIQDITSFRWATVTAVSPVAIQLDGDTAALPLVPESLVDPLTLNVGDRVRVELSLRKCIIHGRATGSSLPSGIIMPAALSVVPSGWLLCDGAGVSRTTYASLFAALNPVIGTTTMTIAAPAVVTKTTHGLQTGQQIYLTTTGALPTGLSVNTGYFVVRIDANTFNLATTLANALVGTKITTTGSQSGIHTLRTTWGVGNGSTTFNVPNTKGSSIVGVDTGQVEFAALGESGGEKAHVLTVAEMPSHNHGGQLTRDIGGPIGVGGGPSGGFGLSQNGGAYAASAVLAAQGGGGAHNNLQPYVTLNYIIKV